MTQISIFDEFAWKKALNAEATRIHELMCLVAGTIFAFFAFFDIHTIPPQDYWTMTFVRLSISFTIIIWLVYQKIYKTPQHYLTLFTAFSITFFCAWACVLGQKQFLFQHNIAFCAVFMAGSIFLLWHWANSAILGLSSMIFYFILSYNYQYFTFLDIVFQGGSILFTLVVINPIIVHYRYQSFKRENEIQSILLNANQRLIKSKEDVDIWNKELIETKDKLNIANLELILSNQSLELLVNTRTQKLENTNLKLQKAIEDLDKFLYSSSHDIKGPIARMRGLISLIDQEEDIREQSIYTDYFLKTIEEMETLIEKLNKVSTINQLNPSYQEIDLNLFYKSIQQKHQDLDLNCHYESNIKFKSDPSLIAIILDCLINNSIKYQSELRKCHISIFTKHQNDKTQIIIEDNGVGIESEIIHKVFDMFYRGNIKADGNGLGLFLAKKAIEKLNGTIKVESEENAYARFIISFDTKD